jgi:hypothetical protein
MVMLSPSKKIGENILTRPQYIVEAFADHFSSIFNSPSSAVIRNNAHFTFSDFLNFPAIYGSYFKQEIRRLNPSKCIGPDEIPSFIIEGCSEIFVPLLIHIFNSSLLKGKFPTLWKQVAVMSVFKKGSSTLITNYRPIKILNNFFHNFLEYNT